MKWFTVVISSITVFITVAGGALAAVMVATEGDKPRMMALYLCAITGLIAAMKDVRATLNLPPLSNGNYNAIAQMVRTTTVSQFNEQKAAQQKIEAAATNPPQRP